MLGHALAMNRYPLVKSHKPARRSAQDAKPNGRGGRMNSGARADLFRLINARRDLRGWPVRFGGASGKTRDQDCGKCQARFHVVRHWNYVGNRKWNEH